MKRVANLYLIVLVALFSILTACSTTTDPAESYKNETAEQIFTRGEDALRDRSYTNALKRFEALDVQYPYGKNTETAQLHMIYCYYMTGDYASAESAADRFIRMHPMNPNVDYAYYMRGLSNYYQNMGVFEKLFAVDLAKRDLTQLKKSYEDFSQLDLLFPKSPYAPAARQYQIYLRNTLANHELEVAQYYFGHEAYVAAANRANLIVRHYEGAPAVPKALVIMVKSYRALHLTQDENDAMRVLQYNFPNSTYTKEAGQI